MPTATATRTIAAAPDAVWGVVGDPHHLPRWWPRVARVEAVDESGFTEVLTGKRGKIVRADFDLVELRERERAVWTQRVEGTPFERVLRSAQTAIELAPTAGAAGPATEVRIELRQELAGGAWPLSLARLGSRLMRRAAARTLQEALEGLELVLGGEDG